MSAAAQPQGTSTVAAPSATSGGSAQSYPMASLYVGDLHWEISEAQLFEKFSQCGPILSIRVCRDMTTRRSLGYAYVNFQNPADAERALDTLNYEVMRGKPVRIMWSQRDPTLRKSGVGNIFIKNLDRAIDNKALFDTFSAFGNILSCKIAGDDVGSKGFGFVHFDNEEAARMAIEKVNGMLLNDKKVFVGMFMPRKDRRLTDGDKKFTNCYIKNVPEEWDDNEMKRVFDQFGEVLSVKVMTDDGGKSRGFGFISYKEPEEAERAVDELNGKEMGAVGPSGRPRTLYVGRAQKKSEREAELRDKYEKLREERSRKWQGVNLYVKNLDDDVDDSKLALEFGKVGTVTSAKVMTDPHTHKSRGFGFVCFSTPEEATRAITMMNGSPCFKKPLYVALAQRKEERQAQLAQQYMQRMSNYRMQLGGAPNVTGPAAAPMYSPAVGAPYYLPQPRMYQPGSAMPPGTQMPRTRFPTAQLRQPGVGVGYQSGVGVQAMTGQNLYQQMPFGAGGQFRPGQPFPGAAIIQQNAAQLGGFAGGARFPMRAPMGGAGGMNAAAAANMMGISQQQLNALASRAITGPGPQQQAFVSGPRGGPMQQRPQQGQTQAQAQMSVQQQQVMAMAGQQQVAQAMSSAAAVRPVMRMPMQIPMPGGAMRMGMVGAPSAVYMPGAGVPGTGAMVVPSAVTAGAPSTATASAAQAQPEPLTAAMLAQAAQIDPNQAKQMLGERLYPIISDWHPQLAGKLTGMLLEMDNGELLHMLEAKDVLRSKVSEAFEVLKEHQRKEQQDKDPASQQAGDAEGASA